LPPLEAGDRAERVATVEGVRIGLSVPIMDEPSALVDIGTAAEANGWDDVFLWHHTIGTPDFAVPMSDAWVVLGALAARTERIRLGTTVTALPRHQPHEVARQTVTLDRLSGGRMVLGVGLGEPASEYTAVGRTTDLGRRRPSGDLDGVLELGGDLLGERDDQVPAEGCGDAG
jgi:alkanesulfonate monooxygenase SsuD/methylene tetrahydromethanopterin reductase-like flavin-dependent oxidoreductase (luciferase family)